MSYYSSLLFTCIWVLEIEQQGLADWHKLSLTFARLDQPFHTVIVASDHVIADEGHERVEGLHEKLPFSFLFVVAKIHLIQTFAGSATPNIQKCMLEAVLRGHSKYCKLPTAFLMFFKWALNFWEGNLIALQ